MRVVHFSTSDVLGGAARAAFRVHTGLLSLGHDSRMRVLKQGSFGAGIERFVPSERLTDRIRTKFRTRKLAAEKGRNDATRPPTADQFSDDRTPWRDQPLRDLPDCDIVNFHWVAGFVDQEAFFRYFATQRPNVPMVWRMADMAPVTGGCHYDQGCGKFTASCGACPMLGSKDENDLSRQVWQRRKSALSLIADDRLHLVATSKWIGEQAAKSSLLGRFACTTIPNALDTDVFRPHDRGFARNVLNIPQDAKVVLFAADSFKQPRKGFAQLAGALEGVKGIDNLVLASVGGGKPQLTGAAKLVHIGKVDDDRILALAYSAADVYVIPSLQESFGQTVIESMACGTPIIGFASGGIVDTVRPGVTGALVPTADVSALRQAIVDLLQNDDYRNQLGRQCRQVALSDYALEGRARSYESLYRTLLDRTNSSSPANTSKGVSVLGRAAVL